MRQPKPRGSGQLLALPKRGQRWAVDVRLPCALVTRGDEDKVHLRTGTGEHHESPGAEELGIVRMSRDAERAFDTAVLRSSKAAAMTRHGPGIEFRGS